MLRRFPVLPNNTSFPPKKIKEAGARCKMQLVWPAPRHISHISLRPSAPGCLAILLPRSIRQRTRGVRPAGGHGPEVQCQNGGGRARSTSDLSPVSPSASSDIWVHHEPLAVGPLEVDAEHAIARLLEKAYDLPPARGIVPAFGLQRVLHRDADIGLGYGRLRSGMAMRSGISVGSM
jgi:hypothetical protein